jgi:hypothetical protein
VLSRAVNPAGAHEALVNKERWLQRLRRAPTISMPPPLMTWEFPRLCRVAVEVRLMRRSGTVAPTTAPEVIVSGLPLTGDHPMHPFAIDARGNMYVDLDSATNSCQVKNRTCSRSGLGSTLNITGVRPSQLLW